MVSYNILADLYCDSDYTREVLHPYCPPYALSIDYRKQLIVKEILGKSFVIIILIYLKKLWNINSLVLGRNFTSQFLSGYNADIICLQEVDKKMFNYDLNILFEDLNFEGDFCQKRGLVAEGLACFFNKSKFEKLDSARFVLSDEMNINALFADIWDKIEANDGLSQRILDRSTVLQIVVLKSLDRDNEVLVVANTHLYFHPDADHIRLLQGGMIIRYLENYIGNLEKRVFNC